MHAMNKYNLSMYSNTYIHTRPIKCVYTHPWIHSHTHIHIQTPIHRYIYKHTYVYVYAYECMNVGI